MAVLSRKTPSIGLLVLWTVLMLVVSVPGAAQDGHEEWRSVATSNLAIVELDEGDIIVELNPAFAPLTVARFRQLARQGFYDGQSFYRVIDGFVAQGGDGSDMGNANDEPTIPAEFERAWSGDLRYTLVQSQDLFAKETGLVDGFPVGRDRQDGRIWLTHCPGAVAMARGSDPDSSSTDFYIVIGQAPRYLDRNLNIFGRVILGMDVVQRIRRGDPKNDGMIDDPAMRTTIQRVRLMEDLDPASHLDVQTMNTSSKEFLQMLERRRDRQSDFFDSKPPQVLDVCQLQIRGRRVIRDSASQHD